MSLNNPNITDGFRKSMGSSFDEFLIKCSYNQKACYGDEWVWYFDAYYGNCWRFNSGKTQNGTPIESLVSTKGGKWNGLSLT
jgi:hypothetical protein